MRVRRGLLTAMPRNVEIKARLGDPDATRRRVAAAADGPPETLEQTDTYFRVAAGRLKLRECSGRAAELIRYERPDTTAPADSRYAKTVVPDAVALGGLLGAALGVRGRVVKRRSLFRVGRTRVHLDDVEGLGAFLELEVEMAEGESATAGADEAWRLMRLFGVAEDALVAEAYVDLLERGGRAGAESPPHPEGSQHERTGPIDDDHVGRLLLDIRDAQRAQLAEHQRIAERFLELQQRAVARQELVSRISKRVALAGGTLVVALLALLVFLLARWWRYPFVS